MSEGALGEHTRLRIPSRVRSRRIADETVILNLDGETYFGLEGVGTDLWDLLGDGATPAQITTALVGVYDVDVAMLEADVRDILGHLLAQGLIVSEQDAGASS